MRAFISLLAMMASLCLSPALHAGTIDVSSALLPLNPASPSNKMVGKLEYLGGLELISHDPRFGGFSGLAVSPDGLYFTAISDRGYVLTGTLRTSMSGMLTGISQTVMADLEDVQGMPLKPGWRDAEDIIEDDDGTFLISFERQHRIAHYVAQGDSDDLTQVGKPIRPPVFESLPFNDGVEAFTRFDADRLLAVSEEGKAWLIDDKDSSRVQMVQFPELGEGFHPTSLARLPDGTFLLLARQYYPLRSGAEARLFHLRPNVAEEGSITLKSELVAELAPPLTVDNMEGLSVRQDADGKLLVYLISDDNYRLWQKTLLMAFRYTP